jgi:hypothetical protein
MNDNLRACLAYIAARLIGGSNRASVYDFARAKHISVSGTVDSKSVNIYDHDRGAHVTGTLPSLYDHGLGSHVSLTVNGAEFSGYDHGSASHYSGRLTGSTVTIFDHGTSQHYQYAE